MRVLSLPRPEAEKCTDLTAGREARSIADGQDVGQRCERSNAWNTAKQIVA